MKYLVDYQGMQDSFLKGQWKVHQNFLPATCLSALNDQPFEFNVDKAKALLAEVG